MNPTQVNPAAWQDHEVIFDMDGFSAIWGRFDEDDNFCLGTRWNGEEDERGYPGQGAYPLRFVIPDYLTLSILERLNTNALLNDLRAENGEPYSTRINRSIRVFMNQSIPQNG